MTERKNSAAGVAEQQTIPASPPVRMNQSYLFTKRFFDIVIAAIAGLVLLLPMVIIGIIIRWDSEGPALFRQERLGKDGKPFIMYKFRSMHLDAEVNGPRWAERDDDRCTKFGRLLRKTRLDELPQLLNILKGDMSFVGPRPERAYFYGEFEKDIPHFKYRLLVQPGLTGHAQVNGGYDLSAAEKIVYDLEYMANRSVWMDLRCIIKTLLVVFTRNGAR